MMTRAMPLPPQRRDFAADHPFLFLLVQKQGRNFNVLFEGKLNEPKN